MNDNEKKLEELESKIQKIENEADNLEEIVSDLFFSCVNIPDGYTVTQENIIERLAQDLNAEILLITSVGDYQGDWLAVLRDKDEQIGFIKIAYGSCGGCDPLMDTSPLEKLEFYLEIKRNIHWEPDLNSLVEYLNQKEEDCSYFWACEDEYKEFKNRLIELANKETNNEQSS